MQCDARKSGTFAITIPSLCLPGKQRWEEQSKLEDSILLIRITLDASHFVLPSAIAASTSPAAPRKPHLFVPVVTAADTVF
ncbi:hypothetical protein RRF57_006101 [Xylaria bambusicola]|uniref:Uncharacterized protein n=1 Tax=Xylaria bambusicola TaxID=326684 RepID=A0AAN7URJ4_9PEZI